ncbi:MAG: hypothetical protein IKT50_04260 [Clostridia bacterium]|nr:hypothetical protein [Clostridia bacterium]
MKKILGFFAKLLPHLTLVLSVMILTFFVIDQFNDAMAFLNNAITKWLICIFSVLTLIQSVLFAIRGEKRP